MSLAQSIAEQLNGRKCGSGWVIPAICHNEGSTKHNLQISDGDNGKLRATCHSNNCDYRTIMEAFESCGYKPLDNFTPEQKKHFKAKASKTDLLKSFWHELHVSIGFLDRRMCDPAKLSDPLFLQMNPNFKPAKPEPEPRETQSIKRLHEITGRLLHDKFY